MVSCKDQINYEEDLIIVKSDIWILNIIVISVLKLCNNSIS